MNLLTVLEVAIGVFFIWFLVSVMVGAVQELLATIFQLRAKDLEKAIHQMLEDPASENRVQQGLERLRAFIRVALGARPRKTDAVNLALPLAGAAAGAAIPTLPMHFQSSAAAGTFTASQNATSISGGKPRSASPETKLFGEDFYKHPLIRGLSFDPEKRGPSYIPTTRFADVIFDLIVNAGGSESPILKAAQQAEELRQRVDLPGNKITDPNFKVAYNEFKCALEVISKWNNPADRNAAAIQEFNKNAARCVEKNPALAPAIQQLQATLEDQPLRRQLTTGVLAITQENGNLGNVLNALVTRAIENAKGTDDAIATARKNVENWFDTSMERLTGHYKRRAQALALLIGCVVALFLNVDSWAIVRTLWFDPTLRAALVSNAQTTASTEPTDIAGKDAQRILGGLQSLQIPLGWNYLTPPESAKPATPAANVIELCKKYYGNLYNQGPCYYPAGYVRNPLYDLTARQSSVGTTNAQGAEALNVLDRPTVWVSLLGIFLTGLATMPGAPFWFELLSKLVNLRATGAVPSSAAAPSSADDERRRKADRE